MTTRRDEYARAIGLPDARAARTVLAGFEYELSEAAAIVEYLAEHMPGSGYARASCIAEAKRMVAGALAVVRHDLDAVGGEEGKT